jgi:hypothetical protein
MPAMPDPAIIQRDGEVVCFAAKNISPNVIEMNNSATSGTELHLPTARKYAFRGGLYLSGQAGNLMRPAVRGVRNWLDRDHS